MGCISRPFRIVIASALVFLAASQAPTGAQGIPTGGAPSGPRTGMIVGQVIDGTSGAPVSEAIVQLTMPSYPLELASTPKGRVMADADGRFFFTDLPAGDYYLQTTKEGYVTGVYGQHRAASQNQLLSLGAGERRSDVKLQLWKYAVVGGTVVDEAGEPVVGASVQALLKDVVAGRPRYGSAPWLIPAATTDDRGRFRMAQMTPGTYVIVVPQTHSTVPASYIETFDTWVRNELYAAGVTDVSLLGQPGVQQVDDFALMTMSTVLIPPPRSASGSMTVYRTTYFPASTSAGAATPIVLTAGAERTDLTIALRPVSARRISGRLVMPDGSPAPPMTLRLAGEAMNDVVATIGTTGLETVTGISDGNGRFSLIGVPPGNYVLTNADRSFRMAAQRGEPAYWISQNINVGASDVRDLVVNVRPGLMVSGTVEVLRHNDSLSLPQLVGRGVGFETSSGASAAFAEVKAGTPPTFSTVAPAGQYIVIPQGLSGWYVRSITLEGKDITDRTFDVQTDVASLVVTYTDRPSKVSGVVRDSRGTASATAAVLVFPVDPQRWLDYGSSPRSLKQVPATATGAFTIPHLPAGEYNLIAIDSAETDGWMDPKTLQLLANQATKVTVAVDDAGKIVDLTVRAIR